VFDRAQYVIEKKLVTVRDTYGVKDVNGNLLGYIKKQILISFRPKFWFEGPDGTRQGEIRYGKLASGKYEVYDAQNQLRATVEWAGGLRRKWRMEDPQGQQLAIAEGDFMGRNYQILAPDGSAIAQIHKKWMSIRGSYCIDISRQGFDPFLILSYAVVMDNYFSR
jgi:uncharacterized protein YxjI